jgi:23S rRNA (cytosine1962-C5)-methyltransferase
LQRQHPWIFESAIAKGSADAGETVRVESSDGVFLAWAAFSPVSRIRARVWSFNEAQRIDAAFIQSLIQKSIQARSLFDIQSNGMRLVHGESDGLPGLVVDRYGDTLVAQFASCGTERFQRCDGRCLAPRPQALANSTSVLMPMFALLRGCQKSQAGCEVRGPQRSCLQEHGWLLSLNIAEGHKTGFYLDQRDSRFRFYQHTLFRKFQNVLNCYCYTGGFTVAALAGGAAHVTSIDSSGPALEKAKANVLLNGFDVSCTTFMDADVNASLRVFIEQGRQFDAIVLDPPKFAPTAAHADRAARAYKDINRLAFKLLAPGGELFTYSCSGGISADLFHKIVASAGTDAGVDGYISERLQGAPDHPMTVYFPEGEYLKGLVVVKKK